MIRLSFPYWVFPAGSPVGAWNRRARPVKGASGITSKSIRCNCANGNLASASAGGLHARTFEHQHHSAWFVRTGVELAADSLRVEFPHCLNFCLPRVVAVPRAGRLRLAWALLKSSLNRTSNFWIPRSFRAGTNVLSQLFKRGRTVVTILTCMMLTKREGRGGTFVTCQYICHKCAPSTLSLITSYHTFVSRVHSSLSTGEYHRRD